MPFNIGAAYVRASTDDQLEYSPDSQIKKIREYARREGYIIPDELVFQDDAISGKKADKRPAFRLMIAQAKADTPPFDCIFVWEYSRFARNQEESIMYKNLLKKNGISVKSVREPLADSPFASLIERIIEWMDEYYLINLSIEVRRGMLEKATRGEAMGRPPFGYSVKNKMYVPDENADTVRYVFERYASGVGYRTISKELADKGIRTKHGRLPNSTWVEYMLHNPAYIGKIRWSEDGRSDYLHPNALNGNAILSDGKHEALIDIETWEKVQERLKMRNKEAKYQRKNGTAPFMLKGIIRCGNCGATLSAVYNSRGTRSLQCCKYLRAECSVSHSILLAKADEAIISALEEITTSENYLFAPSSPPVRTVAQEWDKLISVEREKLRRAQNALLEGAFEPDEYKAIKKEIEQKISQMQENKAKEESTAPATFDASAYGKRVMEVLNIVKSPDMDETAKNHALHSILEKIVFRKPENSFDFFFTL